MLDLDKEALKPAICRKNPSSDSSRRRCSSCTTRTKPWFWSLLPEPVREQMGYRLQEELLPTCWPRRQPIGSIRSREVRGRLSCHRGAVPQSTRWKGRLGPVVDRMFLETPPAVAVRNRRKLHRRRNAPCCAGRTRRSGQCSLPCQRTGVRDLRCLLQIRQTPSPRDACWTSTSRLLPTWTNSGRSTDSPARSHCATKT